MSPLEFAHFWENIYNSTTHPHKNIMFQQMDSLTSKVQGPLVISNRHVESSGDLPRRKVRFSLEFAHFVTRPWHEIHFVFCQKKIHGHVYYVGRNLYVTYIRIPCRIACARANARTLVDI